MPINIVICDDHAMFRESVVELLRREPDFRVIAQTSGCIDTLETVRQLLPDILLVDIKLRDESGISILYALSKLKLPTRAIVLSGYHDKSYVSESIRLGVMGYILKSSSMSELISAIRNVQAGHTYLAPEVTSAALDANFQKQKKRTPNGTGLTYREIEVLRAIAQGSSSREIARQLGVATTTIEVHRRNIRRKLGIRNVADITRWAIDRKVLPQ